MEFRILFILFIHVDSTDVLASIGVDLRLKLAGSRKFSVGSWRLTENRKLGARCSLATYFNASMTLAFISSGISTIKSLCDSTSRRMSKKYF